MNDQFSQTVCIVGLGQVGFPLALKVAENGRKVIGLDTNKKRLQTITNLPKNILLSLDFTLLSQASVVMICVPTPILKNKKPDYRAVISASKEIAKFLRPKQLIILESTVGPGACENVIIPILQLNPQGLKAGTDYYFAHCPERLNIGDKKWNLGSTPRIVGGINHISTSKALSFYKNIVGCPVTSVGSLKEAEAAKILENVFRDVNIALVNELAALFSVLNINMLNVVKAASTKPFGYMPFYPGIGVGGHCIPVDPYYLLETAKSHNAAPRMLSIARAINDNVPKRIAVQLLNKLDELGLQSTKICLLGVAYKPNVSDSRNSPSLVITDQIKRNSSHTLSIYDPHVTEYSTCETLKEALYQAKVVILAVGHDDFKKITLQDLQTRGTKVIVDGSNCYDRQEAESLGLTYIGIGG